MRYKAYKYRIYPTKKQQELINKHIGCCRFIYNLCLEKKINAYKTSKKSLSCFDLINLLPSLKKEQETSFLKEVNSLSLQAAIRNLDSAYKRFFKEKKGFPKFKSKRNARQSFQIVQNTNVDFEENRVFIPKFKESIKCKFHRFFDGKIKTSTISRTSTDRYYLSQRVWTCPNCGRRNQRDLLAAQNIKAFAFNKKHNTAGTAEIHACGDMNPVRDSAQEAHKSLVCG